MENIKVKNLITNEICYMVLKHKITKKEALPGGRSGCCVLVSNEKGVDFFLFKGQYEIITKEMENL